MFDWEAAQHVVEVMAGPETLHVVAELADGPKRYNSLARATTLDHKSLSRRLSRLEHAGLITREVYSGRPLRVHYCLTNYAEPLLYLMDSLGHWWRTGTETH